MTCTFIVSFVGKATPSTIKSLAAATNEKSGKWLISKVNFIEDQVAAVIKIEIPEENADVVKEAFYATPDLLVKIVDVAEHVQLEDKIYQLRIDSNDRYGVVNEITHVLDEQDVQILDMDCQRVFIAGGGGVSSSLFTANLAVRLPVERQLNDVVSELESLSEDTRVIVES